MREHRRPLDAPKSVECVDSLPLSELGKADKQAPRERYWAGVSRRIG